MSKRCFVIMPYGGDDESRRRHFLGVFQSIILPAATRAGYDVKRSDIGREPGNITHDIIRELAEADIVVADLSEANPNVFFELGVRHVLRKSGTVHIIDRDQAIPFDVRQYRAIQYSTALQDLPASIEEISTAISKRSTQPSRPDNPVHDALPDLPIDFTSTGDKSIRDRIRELESALSLAQQAKQTLEQRLEQFDPNGALASSVEGADADQILSEADEIMRSTGKHALLRLGESMEQSGPDGFVKELRTVLASPYLSENDFVEIGNMCHRLGLLEHRRATFEVGMKRYPANDAIAFALADACDDSPIPAVKERGRVILERILGVERSNSGPRMTSRFRGKSTSVGLGLLYNFYFNSNRPEWALSLSESIQKLGVQDSTVTRNRARALALLGRQDEAETEFRRSLELDEKDDTARLFYAEFLDERGRFDEAYVQHEEAILADSADPMNYVNMGIHILNRGLVRDETGKLNRSTDGQKKFRWAMPFIVRGLAVGGDDRRVRDAVVGVVVRAGAMKEAKEIQEGRVPQGNYDGSGLRLIERAIESQKQAEGTVEGKNEEG